MASIKTKDDSYREIVRLAGRGFSWSEIIRKTGCTRYRVDYVLRQRRLERQSELQQTAIKLLYKVPAWWTKSNLEWRRIVRANFGDVLDGATADGQA